MGLIQNIKTFWNLRSNWNKIKEEYMTKGMKSTEFWLTLITGLTTAFQAFQGSLDPKTATIIGAVLTAIYTIARAYVKANETPEEPKA